MLGNTSELGAAAISIHSVCKSFGPTVALSGASFTVPPGTVHALLGENGAGKSTLIKIISGVLQPDSGSIAIGGNPSVIRGRRTAHKLGIETAFQELTQVRELTVAENLLLPYQPRGPFGQLNRRMAEEQAAAELSAHGLSDISVRAEVGDLSLPQRQKLEILRAVIRKPKVLLLDEPTSSLSGEDIDWLGDIIAHQKQAGAAVLFISHRMAEVRRYCDDITILRNGKSVGSFASDKVRDEEVIERIIGRSLDAMFPPKVHRRQTDHPPVLRVENLKSGRAKDISFSLSPGEIIGVSALQGMGQLDLFKALSGDTAVEAGRVLIDGERVEFHSPRDAINSSLGVSFLPEERKTEALLLKMDGTFNATLPILSRISRFGIPDRRREQGLVEQVFKTVEVTDRAIRSPMAAFSGGNQQKVVLAKWLLAKSRIMLLFDPTRGVDVGTKYEIYTLINDYLAQGGAVLLYSSEIDEITNLCDRVLIMYAGNVVKVLDRGENSIPETDVMRAVLGTGQDMERHVA